MGAGRWVRRGVHGSAAAALAAKLPTSHKVKTPAGPGAAQPLGSGGASHLDSFRSLRSVAAGKIDVENDRRALHAVNVAIKANAAIFVCKLAAYGVTGSSAMLAEAVHSIADVLNQGGGASLNGATATNECQTPRCIVPIRASSHPSPTHR